MEVRAQYLTHFEGGLSVGPRNLGLLFTYKTFQNLDIVIGCEAQRYGNFGYNLKIRVYPWKDFTRTVFIRGTPYFGVGYKSFNSSRYNYEDSRNFVPSFYVPSHEDIICEVGYRYNLNFSGIERIYSRGRSSIHQDFSVGITYSKTLNDALPTIIRGEDVDGKLQKINNFLAGGIGMHLIFHFSVRHRPKVEHD